MDAFLEMVAPNWPAKISGIWPMEIGLGDRHSGRWDSLNKGIEVGKCQNDLSEEPLGPMGNNVANTLSSVPNAAVKIHPSPKRACWHL